MRHLLLLLSLAAGPALAQAQSDQPAAVQADKPAKVKKKCRSEVPTGSMMAHRTCHTDAEWQQIDEANARATESMTNQRNRNGGTGG